MFNLMLFCWFSTPKKVTNWLHSSLNPCTKIPQQQGNVAKYCWQHCVISRSLSVTFKRLSSRSGILSADRRNWAMLYITCISCKYHLNNYVMYFQK